MAERPYQKNGETPCPLKTGDAYRFVLKESGEEFAVMAPDAWQGNVRIISPRGKHCGIAWPHFLMNSEGKWLTDKVESEGMKLVDFEVTQSPATVIGYRGKWVFRDYFSCSETHFTWHEPAESTRVHLVRTQLRILKDLEDITTIWVEFMTRENSYTTAAALAKGGKVITMDVSTTGPRRNMHHWDGRELEDGGWIAIYGAQNDQGGCAALVPLTYSPGPVRARVNNGHVDNIEMHLLDARKRNGLTKGQEFFLEYLLIAGPDKKDWKWIAPAVERARAFMERSKGLLDTRRGSVKVEQGTEGDAAGRAPQLRRYRPTIFSRSHAPPSLSTRRPSVFFPNRTESPKNSYVFRDVRSNDRLLGISRANQRCLCWGDLRAGFEVSRTEPNRGGCGVPRTQGLLGCWPDCRCIFVVRLPKNRPANRLPLVRWWSIPGEERSSWKERLST